MTELSKAPNDRGCKALYYYLSGNLFDYLSGNLFRWEDDAVAPDYARCIDIHRKPGYDPVELFIDPGLKCPQWKVAKFLLKKKLGFRGLLDVIPLDATLVKGSHGRDEVPEDEQPLVIGRLPRMPESAEEVFDAIASFYECA